MALAAALLAALVPTTLYFLRAPEEKTAIRLEMETPGMVTTDFPAISPDGQYVAYVAQADGKSSVWIRPIGDVEARPLAGTENGRAPFWSPDSRNIAFFADGKLKRISIAGGSATTLAETDTLPSPGAWNHDGIILFSSITMSALDRSELVRISDKGGAVTPVNTQRDGAVKALPQFLPDGRHFLYLSFTAPTAKLYVGSLDGGTPVHIMSSGTLDTIISGVDFPGRYAAPGYLLFVSGGILMAQRFDEKHLTLTGEAVPISEPAGSFSVSAQQTVVYRRAQAGPQQVVWVNRSGSRGPSVTMPGTFEGLRLSPDGRRLALDQNIGGNTDIWVIDLDRGIPNRLTTDPAVDEYPRFSPDGNQIVFTSRRSGAPRMFIGSSVTMGAEQPLPSETPSDRSDIAEDWSLDNKYVVFVRSARDAPPFDIWVKPMFGDGKPFPFVHSSSFVYGQPRLSPNSRWLAYMTNESGTYQIVVQTFPHPSEKKKQVTAQGGLYPTWRRDGRELYYLALDGKLMAVPVKDGDQLEFGDPKPLFPAPLTIPTNPAPHLYDVSADGERFVFIANNISPATPNNSGKLTVVLNWTSALRKK
jgi:Tol biopolymer transport system component